MKSQWGQTKIIKSNYTCRHCWCRSCCPGISGGDPWASARQWICIFAPCRPRSSAHSPRQSVSLHPPSIKKEKTKRCILYITVLSTATFVRREIYIDKTTYPGTKLRKRGSGPWSEIAKAEYMVSIIVCVYCPRHTRTRDKISECPFFL